MLEKLSAIAIKLVWALPLVRFLLVASLCLFFLAVFELTGIESKVYLIPSVLGLLWSVLLLCLLITFPEIPKKLSKESKFIAKTKNRIKLGIYYFLALLFIILSIVITILSFRIIQVWLADLGQANF